MALSNKKFLSKYSETFFRVYPNPENWITAVENIVSTYSAAGALC